MQAKDIMTKAVLSVAPDTTVAEVAKLLLDRRISAAPVVAPDNKVLGIVSEGDLMRRAENDTDARHSWWLAELFSGRDPAVDYIKSHARKSSDVMTRNVKTVTEETSLREIAQVLEQHHIKRVPVVRNDKLVGIVSRANLLHGLASTNDLRAETSRVGDRKIRDDVLRTISNDAGLDTSLINVIVDQGAVEMWGMIRTSEQKKAAQVAAENTPGVKSIKNHLALIPPYYGAE